MLETVREIGVFAFIKLELYKQKSRGSACIVLLYDNVFQQDLEQGNMAVTLFCD